VTLAEFVIAAMGLLAPERDHAELAGAIVRAVDAEAPLWKNDDDKRRTAAIVVAVAFRESSLRLGVTGDKGRSFCAMQIHQSSGGTAALLTDADACVRKGLAMLRASLRTCPAHPVAWYASGPIGCTDARAQRISSDRMALAARVVRDVAKAEKERNAQ
jgi:hypothetical protein